MQFKLAVFIHHGMTGVISALVTPNDIGRLRKVINHAPFTFVAPIGTNNDSDSGRIHCVRSKKEFAGRIAFNRLF
jgi:hypothetical protein